MRASAPGLAGMAGPGGARPGVMLVTGAYYPELSGAGLQARALVRSLAGRVDFVVLTTTTDRALAGADRQDGVDVHRIFVNPGSWWSKASAAVRCTLAFLRTSRRFSIVHLHGFSQKSILLIALARLARKQVAIKLTSVGHDDPVSISLRGRLARWCYSQASAFFAVSSRFRQSYDEARLPGDRFRLIPNGVDLARFRPGTPEERDAIRRELDLPADAIVVLFVGFFSEEKRPVLLFDAWSSLVRSTPVHSVLLFVGATRSPYYEIDERLAETIRARAAAAGLERRVRFVERSETIELVHRAADIFVLPSVREGLPNALMEAMASATACVATRLAGVTEDLIDDGRNGLLVERDDAAGFEAALRRFVETPELAARLGAEARRTMEARFGLDRVAEQYLSAYRDLLEPRPCAA